jgi:hypothetical protein
MASRKSKRNRNRNRKTRTHPAIRPRPAATNGVSSPPVAPELAALELRPKPLDGERLEDRAVFTRNCREQLDSPLSEEAEAVWEALELVHQGKFEPALERLRSISRQSPFADWRLLVRGLVAFYQGDIDAARQNWGRLDGTRRPGRIAATLLRAETELPLEGEVSPPPKHLVEAARTLRLRKQMLEAARRIAAVAHSDSDEVFSTSQVAMLQNFRDRFQRVDAEFAMDFGRSCVRLATCQPLVEPFRLLKSSVPGPAQDPHWNLLAFAYWTKFEGAEVELERVTKACLDELAGLDQVPEPLRAAMAARICMVRSEQAQEGAARRRRNYYPFRRPDSSQIEKWLREAIRWYPSYRDAHHRLVDLLEREADQDNSKSDADARLLAAKEALVQEFPDEVDATLWLIDRYFESDALDRVGLLVQRLQDQRLDDPRARALPWKLKLREAMRLCRRKNLVSQARETLDSAESLWPAWLRRDWLPYLRAAIELRGGDPTRFEQLDAEARKASGLPDCVASVMAMAAAQLMNVPSAQLKPFRKTVDDHVANAHHIPLKELCLLGSFFWDLNRTGLRHGGYRLQASRIGKVLCDRLDADEPFPNDAACSDAISWMARHRFWLPSGPYAAPHWVSQLGASQPKVAAAHLEFLLESGYDYEFIRLGAQIQLVEEAARTERDAFLRHRFSYLAKEAKSHAAAFPTRSPYPGGSSFNFPDEFYDDDEYDDEDDDFECDCPACQAERAARARAAGSRNAQAMDWYEDEKIPGDIDDDEDEDDDEDFPFDEADLGRLPKILPRVMARLGPDGATELESVLSRAQRAVESGEDPVKAFDAALQLFARKGVSEQEALQFMLALGTGQGDFLDDDEDEDEDEDELDFDAEVTSDLEFKPKAEAADDLNTRLPRGSKASAAERRRRQRMKKRNR